MTFLHDTEFARFELVRFAYMPFIHIDVLIVIVVKLGSAHATPFLFTGWINL